MASPSALAGRLWQAPVPWPVPLGTDGLCHATLLHRVLTWCLGAGLLYGAKVVAARQSSPDGDTLGGSLQAEPGQGAHGQPMHWCRWEQTEPAPRSCVYQGCSATWHIPGESLFSGLQEFLPLLQPPPTPHARKVPSFIWQHCPAQFAT